MRHSNKFNPKRDLSPVAQYGYVDLREAFLTNTIPSQMEGDDTQFNDIEDPGQILGMPKDIFEGFRMVKALANMPTTQVANEPKGE